MKPNKHLAAAATTTTVPTAATTASSRRLFLASAKVDADTSVPYCVVGSPPPSTGSSGRFFNLVICHDIFDNYERMKIVVAPVIARYPGAQVRRNRAGEDRRRA